VGVTVRPKGARVWRRLPRAEGLAARRDGNLEGSAGGPGLCEAEPVDRLQEEADPGGMRG
jgi:hypothetical protein